MASSSSLHMLIATTIFLMVGLSSGSKFISIGVAREKLADSEFSFSFKKDGIPVNATGIRAEALAAPRHRLLGMPDVDVTAVRVVQQPKAVIPWHVHPRSAEHYATIKGVLKVTITLEGSFSPRRVVSKLPPAYFSSIPQGIPHTVTCISKTPCVYHIFFNSADAGTAFIDSGKNEDDYQAQY